MPSFHFTVGKPTDLLYIDACLSAPNAEAAVEKLRSLVPGGVDLTPQGYEAVGGYAQILINCDAIGAQHIDRVDEDTPPVAEAVPA